MKLKQLFLGLALISFGALTYNEVQESSNRIEALKTRGIKAEGRLENMTKVDHKRNGSHTHYSYTVEASYIDKNRARRLAEIHLSESEAQAYISGNNFRKDAPIRIVYLPEEPVPYVTYGDREIQEGSGSLISYGISLALAVLGAV